MTQPNCWAIAAINAHEVDLADESDEKWQWNTDHTDSTNEDTFLNGDVSGNDSTTSGGTLTYAKATDPTNGAVTVNANGTYSYTPDLNFNGTDSFTYTVTDADSGEMLTQTVNITVNPVNDARIPVWVHSSSVMKGMIGWIRMIA